MTQEPTEGELRAVMLVVGLEQPIECNVAAEFEYDGHIYLVVTPTDELVSVIRVAPGETEDDDDLEELEVEEFVRIADFINRELKRDLNVYIAQRGNELVLMGDIPDDLYDGADELEVETDEGDERTLLIFAEIDTGDVTYMVAAYSGYILYPAIQNEDGTARPLYGEELADIRDVFEEVYAELEAGGECDPPGVKVERSVTVPETVDANTRSRVTHSRLLTASTMEPDEPDGRYEAHGPALKLLDKRYGF